MARRKFTVDRYQEIERRLAEGRGLREISAGFRVLSADGPADP
jgi:hypothetical protein